jgi:hypothetical protein
VKKEEEEEKIETATRTRSTRRVSWHDSFDLWHQPTNLECFQENGRVPADMYVTRRYLSTLLEDLTIHRLRYRPNRTFRTGEKAGRRSDTGTSESTSLLPTFQFAAQSRSWEGPRGYIFLQGSDQDI